MHRGAAEADLLRLRRALGRCLVGLWCPQPALAAGWLLAQADAPSTLRGPGTSGPELPPDDHDLAVSSADSEEDRERLIALVDLARGGDREAFGLLYDHYLPSVYRFVYYRVGSTHVAEDLTGETFFRALRNMSAFKWQGRDFGAWLMTIARNLTTDHYKAGRTRLEVTTEDNGVLDGATDDTEEQVLAALTNEALLEALDSLPSDQHECLVLRFLQGQSIQETAEIMQRSLGAIKQLQFRAVRNLAAALPEGIR